MKTLTLILFSLFATVFAQDHWGPPPPKKCSELKNCNDCASRKNCIWCTNGKCIGGEISLGRAAESCWSNGGKSVVFLKNGCSSCK